MVRLAGGQLSAVLQSMRPQDRQSAPPSGAASAQGFSDVFDTFDKTDDYDVVGQAARAKADHISTPSSVKVDITLESAARAAESHSVNASPSVQAQEVSSATRSDMSSASHREQAQTVSTSKPGQQSKQMFTTTTTAKKPVLAPPIQQVSTAFASVIILVHRPRKILYSLKYFFTF